MQKKNATLLFVSVIFAFFVSCGDQSSETQGEINFSKIEEDVRKSKK